METNIVKSLVKCGDTVVDLGANIGYYTLLLARQVGRDGKVVAFEPSPTNCEILEKNVKMNGYRNVEINQLAVADKSGKAKLQLTPNPADSRIRSENYELDKGRNEMSEGSVDIETISLDDYFCEREEEDIDFIKMDIQGAEFSALLGMQRTLSKSKNIQILTEFFPKLLKESGTEPSDYLNILQQNGFHIYNFDEKDSKMVPADLNDLLVKYPEETDLYTNLLLTREHIDDTVRNLNV
ncbi:MAG: FkbM family methyltransferase [Nitrososphaeraceae archaeon]